MITLSKKREALWANIRQVKSFIFEPNFTAVSFRKSDQDLNVFFFELELLKYIVNFEDKKSLSIIYVVHVNFCLAKFN